MSAPVDSLSIKVDASARSASQQLDKLVQKMVQLRSTVNGINIGNLNKMATSIHNFSKAVTGLNQVKASDFNKLAKNIERLANVNASNLDKSAQSVEKAANSLQRASSVSQKAISSGLKFDTSGVQGMRNAIQSLSNEFANAGKGSVFEGTLAELEKQADKLRKKLDSLAEKEEKILTVGGTSTESKSFRNLQYDISKTMNQLTELEGKIAQVCSAQGQSVSSISIFRHDDSKQALADYASELERIKKSMQTSGESMAKAGVLDTPIRNTEIMLERLKSAFPEATGLISSYVSVIERLKGMVIETPKMQSIDTSALKKGKEEIRQTEDVFKSFKENLSKLVVPEVKEDNLDKLESKLHKAESSLEELRVKLANGITMGRITESIDDTGFRNIQEQIALAEKTVESLKMKIEEVRRESSERIKLIDDSEIQKTNSLGSCVEQLKAKLKDLQSQGLNFGDAKFDSTYKELQKSTAELKKYKTSLNDTGTTVQSVAKKIGDAFRSIWNATKNAGSGIVSFGNKIKSLTTCFHSMSSSTNGLIGKLMKLYIGFRSLKSVTSFLKDSIESSMDYIEEYNYFSTTMDKISSEWSKDYKKFGYENADEYGKSFKGRLTDTLTKMTGFQMEDDGTVTDTGTKNLGLDVTEMTNYAAGVAQVTNSVGMVGEASTVTSKALSMLAGDMSSFRNQEMSTVMNSFSSGLIGQSRALYQYGIDITNATLATYAHDLGIKKNITDMTQMEKMQLRMIAILDQSKVAWGDLAKTINSPSNQLRLLQNNFNTLSRTIGNIFLPVVAKVLPYINGLVIAIRRLFEWSASLLGIDLSDIIQDSGAGGSNAFDGLEEDANNASSAVDDTTDSVKKLSRQLMGFDELNVITTNQSSSNGSDSNSGDSTPIDLTSQLSAALADYEKVWNDAYANMTSDAEKFANKLTKLFKDAWISGDGSDIGSAIASWLNKGISWVNENWSVADEKVQKIANILATAVNGFTYEFDWSGLGTALSNTLQTWLNGQTTFFDNTDWTALGKGVATSLNSFIGENGDGPIQSYFKSLGSKLKAAIEFAFGAVTTFNFTGLGSAIGQGITSFFRKMSVKNEDTGLNGWEELGQTISDSILGIIDTITVALKTVPWQEVGQAIADFIKNIKWEDIVWNLAEMFSSFVQAFKDLLKGAGMSDSLADLTVSVGIGGWVISKLSKTALGKAVLGKIGGKLSVPIQRACAVISNWVSNKSGVALTKLKNAVASKLGKIAVTVKNAVASIGKWAVNKWNTSGLKAKIANKVSGLTFAKAIKVAVPLVIAVASVAWAADVWGEIYDASQLEGSEEGKSILDDALEMLKEDIENGDFHFQLPFDIELPSYNELSDAFELWWNDPKSIGGTVHYISLKAKGTIDDVAKKIKSWWSLAKQTKKTLFAVAKGTKEKAFDTVSNAWKKFTGGVKTVWAKAKGKAESAFDSISNKWEDFKAGTKELWVKAKGKIEDTFSNASDTWNSVKDGAKDIWIKAKGTIDDSFGKVSDEWDKVKSGIKNLLVNAKGDMKESFSKIHDKWNDLAGKTKDALIKLAGSTGDSFSTAKNKWESIKSRTATLTATAKQKASNVFQAIKDKWNAISSKTSMLTATFNDMFTKPLKSAWNALAKTINSAIKTINKIPGVNIKASLPTLAKGGIFSNGKWHDIARYANGGLPGMGQMFVAREAGPELVGTIGGHTAVMNNNQIVASVSDGVFNALAPVLTQVVNSINALNSRVGSMSSSGVDVEKYKEGDLLRVVRKEGSNYKKRTGKSAFAY